MTWNKVQAVIRHFPTLRSTHRYAQRTSATASAKQAKTSIRLKASSTKSTVILFAKNNRTSNKFFNYDHIGKFANACPERKNYVHPHGLSNELYASGYVQLPELGLM